MLCNFDLVTFSEPLNLFSFLSFFFIVGVWFIFPRSELHGVSFIKRFNNYNMAKWDVRCKNSQSASVQHFSFNPFFQISTSYIIDVHCVWAGVINYIQVWSHPFVCAIQWAADFPFALYLLAILAATNQAGKAIDPGGEGRCGSLLFDWCLRGLYR